MTLQQFEKRLEEALPGLVYELASPKGSRRYVCWHTYGRSSTYGDDRNQIDAPKVQIDIYTQDVDDTLVDDVCAALWLMDLPYIVVAEEHDDAYTNLRTILQLVVI